MDNKISHTGSENIENHRDREGFAKGPDDRSALLDYLPGMAFRFRATEDWPLELISAGSYELCGYKPAELLASETRSFWSLVHPDDRKRVFDEIQTRLAEGGAFKLTYRILCASGETRWVCMQGKNIAGPGHTPGIVAGFVHDTSEEIQAQLETNERYDERERELERSQRFIEGLRDILAALNSTRSFDEILDLIVLQSRELLGASAAVIYKGLMDEFLIAIAASNGAPAELEKLGKLPFFPEAVNMAVFSRKPHAVPELDKDVTTDLLDGIGVLSPLIIQWKEIIRKNFRAYLTVPLVIKDELYGALALYYQEPHQFREEDIRLGMTLGGHVALAIENALLRDQIEQSAVVAERNRLARDLHDAVTQTLFSVSLIAEVLPRLWERNREEGLRRLEELRELTRGALAEMRTLLLELRPASLAEAETKELFHHLADAFIGRARIPVDLEIKGECDLPAEVKVAFYRIAQEMLNNVAKHAEANHVKLSLECQNEGVHFFVEDDGIGFDPSIVSPENLGLGIMKERAESIGAELLIQSSTGKGTRMILDWKPLENRN